VAAKKSAKQASAKRPAGPSAKDVAKAAADARRGNTDVALAALRGYADLGSAAAAAAAAEILAFRGEWEEAATRATELLAQPDAVYSANIFEGCAAIVRRAAEVLDRPRLVQAAAERVPTKLASVRDAVLLRDWFRVREETREPRPEALAEALALAPTLRRFKGKPASELDRHCFSLAVAFDVDEQIVRRWDVRNEALGFEQAIEAARAFARRGEPERAWDAVASRTWWPIENTQVAPVELVTDYLLHPVMTAGRCEKILARPRGAPA